jgi:hypothetical protein
MKLVELMYGKWDETLKFYGTITDNPKFGLQARKMLEVIPMIRSTPEFKEVVGWAAHTILTMAVVDKPHYLRVWAESENTFLVYIEHLQKGRLSGVYVTREELMPTLIDYLQKLE